jgi:hypothetical protein
MPKKKLDDAHVRSAFEKVNGKGMTPMPGPRLCRVS